MRDSSTFQFYIASWKNLLRETVSSAGPSALLRVHRDGASVLREVLFTGLFGVPKDNFHGSLYPLSPTQSFIQRLIVLNSITLV
jgi:hypothetical protein